jgi:DNA-binding MarR family transcriptional regulator
MSKERQTRPPRPSRDSAQATRSAVAAAVAEPELRALIDRLPLWRRPGYLIRRLHQIHRALFLEECGAFDITPVQYALLTTLSLKPDNDQNSLAHDVGLDRANVAEVLGRMEKQGLIVRQRSAKDGRMILARLTPDGERVTAAMHAGMSRAQERLLGALGPGEREQFLSMLLQLVDANNQVARAALAPERKRRKDRAPE